MNAEIKVFEDRIVTGQWRVEYFDDDGGCYVAIFAGPGDVRETTATRSQPVDCRVTRRNERSRRFPAALGANDHQMVSVCPVGSYQLARESRR